MTAFDDLEAANARIAELESTIKKHDNYIKCHCLAKSRNPTPGSHHQMRCRSYIGPLTHKMSLQGINWTFGGADFNCTCGGWFRQGGIAGHGDGSENAEVICPHANETWRGPGEPNDSV